MPSPTGKKLEDGFSTIITFQNAPTISLWERGVKPPGVDAGGEIDTTTMRNLVWRTRAAKKLKTLTNVTVTSGYDPQVINTIVAQAQVNQQITIKFPDGATLMFYGFLDKFEPAELTEGNFPTAAVTIVPTNEDNLGNEVAPVYTAPPP